MNKENKKKIFVVGLQLAIAVSLVLGSKLTNQPLRILYYSYYADFFLPFGFYFLLSLKGAESKYFNTWRKKALAVFVLCTTSEILQYFGIFALARVFDPIDIVMYGVGVLLAALIDREIFAKHLSFWE